MDEVLDFYFQSQSLSMSTDQGSVIAATLANGGVCPLSKSPCMSSSSVRDTLSTMHSCGLYDYSGRWAFEVAFYVFHGGVFIGTSNYQCFPYVGFRFSPQIDHH